MNKQRKARMLRTVHSMQANLETLSFNITEECNSPRPVSDFLLEELISARTYITESLRTIENVLNDEQASE